MHHKSRASIAGGHNDAVSDLIDRIKEVDNVWICTKCERKLTSLELISNGPCQCGSNTITLLM